MNELLAINTAFLDAFNLNKLEQLVSFGLGEKLETISTGSDLTQVVFELTEWADREGRIAELIVAAKSQSQNPAIRQLKTPKQRSNVLLDETDPSSIILMEQKSDLGSLLLRVAIMERDIGSIKEDIAAIRESLGRDIESVRGIVVGPNGDNGVRSLARENARNLADIKKIVLTYGEVIEELKFTVGTGPDLFKSTQSKVIFGLIILFLVSIFLVLISGTAGWI